MNEWQSFEFRMSWPAGGSAPRWWIDVLLLDRVVRAVLERHRRDVSLWRVHRRASPRDEKGHQFSLLCFADEDTHVSIDALIQAHAVVGTLQEGGLLREYLGKRKWDSTRTRSSIEDTSDRSWPMAVQRTWPHFAMGVSKMLLGLVRELRPSDDAGPADTAPIIRHEVYYTAIEEQLHALWRENGSHVFFHHINALFGYVPVLARPRSLEPARQVGGRPTFLATF